MMSALSVLFIVALLNGARAAAFDCNHSPDVNINVKCCTGSNILTDDLEKICNPLKTQECVVECVFNATGIIGAKKDEINMDRVKAHLKDALKTEPENIPAMERSFEKCGSKVHKLMENRATPADQKCKPFANEVIECIMLDNYANCPTNKWNGTEQCNTLRNFGKACPLA